MSINQSNNELYFVNSFHASRLNGAQVNVSGSSCYLWKLYLKKSSMIPYISLAFVTQSKNEVAVDPFVGPHRVCDLVHRGSQILQRATESVGLDSVMDIYHYRCKSITENDYILEKKLISNVIEIITEAEFAFNATLFSISIAGHHINDKNNKPECGKPEMQQTGLQMTNLQFSNSKFGN